MRKVKLTPAFKLFAAAVMLFVGMALALTATVLYVRSGLEQARAKDAAADPAGSSAGPAAKASSSD